MATGTDPGINFHTGRGASVEGVLEGWRDDDPTADAVTLHLPAPDVSAADVDAESADADRARRHGGVAGLLRLVDDDKQAGLTQASLPDMFFRLSMRREAS